MRAKQLFLVLLFLFAASIYGQETGIAGKYEGAVDSPQVGKLAITAEIRNKDGKLSGVFNTPLGPADILDGSFANGKLLLKLDAGGDDIFLNGARNADGNIVGEISSDNVKGTFTLKRIGDAPPERSAAIVTAQSKEKWREDLRFLAAELPKKHKNAFHRISREQFAKLVGELDAKIPNLSDDEIILGMGRIAAQIGDGHTSLSWWQAFPQAPMRLFWFGKELRVVRVSKEYPRLNGARLLKIGGVTVEQIYERSREYISQGESEQFVLDASGRLLTRPVLMKTLGLTKDLDKAVYEFIDANGKKFSLELKSASPDSKIEWLRPYKIAPLYLQKENEPLSYAYLPAARTVYVNFKWYPRRAEFAKFSKNLFDFVDANPVEKLVIDVRQNGGGDFTRGRDFLVKQIKERKQFLEPGRLFVVIGRETYSAGMANAADFKNELNAFLVGEPTGARPNGYQENRGFSLPNSNLPVSYSIEFYKFSKEDTPGILPDKLIEPDWKSYRAGRDTALEWILARPKLK